MITLTELLQYLQLNAETLDSARKIILQSFIDMSSEELNSICNRKFTYAQYTEKITPTANTDKIFVQNIPIESIDEIKKYDEDTNSFVTIFENSDTITNSTINNGGLWIILTNGYQLNQGSTYQVKYKGGYKNVSLTGTANVSANSKTVTGSGTLFQTELSSGDSIIINGERRVVDAIASNTSLTVTSYFIATATGQTITLTTVPDDLRKACLLMSAYAYKESGQADNFFFYSQSTVNGEGSTTVVYKKPDLKDIISNYTIPNI